MECCMRVTITGNIAYMRSCTGKNIVLESGEMWIQNTRITHPILIELICTSSAWKTVHSFEFKHLHNSIIDSKHSVYQQLAKLMDHLKFVSACSVTFTRSNVVRVKHLPIESIVRTWFRHINRKNPIVCSIFSLRAISQWTVVIALFFLDIVILL